MVFPSRGLRFEVILQDQSDGRSPERNLPFNMKSSSVGQQKDISRARKKGGRGKKEKYTRAASDSGCHAMQSSHTDIILMLDLVRQMSIS